MIKISIFLILIVFALQIATGRMMYFERIGETGWKSFIPFYGSYLDHKITNNTKGWVLRLIFLVLAAAGYAGLRSSVSASLPKDIMEKYGAIIEENFPETKEEQDALIAAAADEVVETANYSSYKIWFKIIAGGCLFFLLASMYQRLMISNKFEKSVPFSLGLLFFPAVHMTLLGKDCQESHIDYEAV